MSDWRPGDPVHSRPRVDLEVSACEVIDNAFGALDDAAQARVLAWASSRYVVPTPVDWPARFRAAADAAEAMDWEDVALRLRAVAREMQRWMNVAEVEAIGRELLGGQQ